MRATRTIDRLFRTFQRSGMVRGIRNFAGPGREHREFVELMQDVGEFSQTAQSAARDELPDSLVKFATYSDALGELEEIHEYMNVIEQIQMQLPKHQSVRVIWEATDSSSSQGLSFDPLKLSILDPDAKLPAERPREEVVLHGKDYRFDACPVPKSKSRETFYLRSPDGRVEGVSIQHKETGNKQEGEINEEKERVGTELQSRWSIGP